MQMLILPATRFNKIRREAIKDYKNYLMLKKHLDSGTVHN